MLSELFHTFTETPVNIVLPKLFTCPFCYTPHPLAVKAANDVQRYLSARTDWASELAQGKMFGVLVVKDTAGKMGYLAAFSGNIAGNGVHSYFVPPIFDISAPDGHFRIEERAISELNHRIDAIANSDHYRLAANNLANIRQQAEAEIGRARSDAMQHKAQRDTLRRQPLSDEQKALLVSQSQHEKAELKRLSRRWAAEIAAAEEKVDKVKSEIERIKEQRRQKSEELQEWLFEQYVVLNARGERKTIRQIFADERGTEPPAATGECAAPKLLQFAFLNHYQPIAMAEFWWGQSPAGEVRRHGAFYPACHSKCEPLLNFMLQGLNVEPNRLKKPPVTELKIIYNDRWIAAVDKPAGLPSVPGKEHLQSVYSIVRQMFPDADGPLLVHRLDMETSGVLLIAKTKNVFVALQRQFAARRVKKRYVALLDGLLKTDDGTISLPIRPNPDDRPRQMVDFEHGKEAVTRFSVEKRTNDYTLVNFYPETGRTHQLRVHAAHQAGLGCPIVGDNLYGKPAERLMLHAAEIVFTHPITGEKTIITADVPFLTQAK